MKIYIYLLLFISIVFSACYQAVGIELPSDVIHKEKMINILVDVHMTEGYLSGLSSHEEKDTLAANYYASIFKAYDIDSTAFNYSMNAYMKNPNELLDIYNIVLEKLEQKYAQQSN